jgi:hypothetical protein
MIGDELNESWLVAMRYVTPFMPAFVAVSHGDRHRGRPFTFSFHQVADGWVIGDLPETFGRLGLHSCN